MKKILSMVTLLVLLVGSVFAFDWVRYGDFKNEKAGTYLVYFDYDATEPFELEKESIELFLWFQKNYKKVEVHLFSGELAQKENWWCLTGTKYNCFSTLEIYEDYAMAMEYHVNKDGTITQYTYWINEEEE